MPLQQKLHLLLDFVLFLVCAANKSRPRLLASFPWVPLFGELPLSVTRIYAPGSKYSCTKAFQNCSELFCTGNAGQSEEDYPRSTESSKLSASLPVFCSGSARTASNER